MPLSFSEINMLIANYAGISQQEVPQQFTDLEWEELTSNDAFPSLVRESCWRLRPAVVEDESHNCVGWSIGDVNCFEFNYDLQTMINFYKTKGYERVKTGGGDAIIDLWINKNGTFAHASRKYRGLYLVGMPGNLWESFPYPMETFTHGRFDIQNGPKFEFNKIGASLRLNPNFGNSSASSSAAISPKSSSSKKVSKKK